MRCCSEGREASVRLGHKSLRTLMKRSSSWYLPGDRLSNFILFLVVFGYKMVFGKLSTVSLCFTFLLFVLNLLWIGGKDESSLSTLSLIGSHSLLRKGVRCDLRVRYAWKQWLVPSFYFSFPRSLSHFLLLFILHLMVSLYFLLTSSPKSFLSPSIIPFTRK